MTPHHPHKKQTIPKEGGGEQPIFHQKQKKENQKEGRKEGREGVRKNEKQTRKKMKKKKKHTTPTNQQKKPHTTRDINQQGNRISRTLQQIQHRKSRLVNLVFHPAEAELRIVMAVLALALVLEEKQPLEGRVRRRVEMHGCAPDEGGCEAPC